MPQEIFKNTFERGLVSDFDESIQPQGTYRDAYNVKLDKDGSNFIVSNMGGSEVVVSINDSFTGGVETTLELTNIEGSVWADTYFDSNLRPGIWIFSTRRQSGTSLYTYSIYCIDVELSASYKVFEESDVSGEYDSSELDFIVFGEGGVNYIYATDGVRSPMKIKCSIDTSNPTISKENLDLFPLYPTRVIDVSSISQTGGSLLTGAYQFSYRLIRNEEVRSGSSSRRNIYSKWSLLTNPVLIHKTNTDNNNLFTYRTYGALAEQTSKSINLQVQIASEEASFYTHIEFAVVENLSGSTIPPSVAKRLFAFELPENPTTYFFEYKGGDSGVEIPIDDIVVDSSGIDSAKTLTIKNNRLLLGNINYSALEYDNGSIEIDPILTTPIKKTISRDSNPNFTSYSVLENSLINGRGYFRDETYRFAISYFDDKGNFSSPKTIDFSSVNSNRASFGSVDFRFPDRSEVGWNLLNTINEPDSLGLRISGIKNHPSWAKGFVILRARRKKKVKFQTPLIPVVLVEPQVVKGNYPSDPTDATLQSSEAQPPILPGGTLVPKNFRYGSSKSIRRDSSNVHYWDFSRFDSEKKVYVIFPPEDLYNTDGVVVDRYNQSSNDYIRSVDSSLLYCIHRDSTGNAYDEGDTIDTNVTSLFFSNKQEDYYYGISSKIDIPTAVGTSSEKRYINQYIDIENGQSKGIISGNVLNFGDYDGLNATNASYLPEGYPATNQKCKVVSLSSIWHDVAEYSYGSNTGDGARSGLSYNGTTLPGISGVEYLDVEASNSYNDPNKYLSAVETVNVQSDIGDDRYGDIDSLNEFYFTGAFVRLSSSDIENNIPKTIDVFGGDCFVGYHTFKITDTTYSIATQENSNQIHNEKWGLAFVDGSERVTRPIPVKAHNQYLALYLESEVEPQFESERFFDRSIISFPLDPSSVREITPQYTYNISYSQQNNSKVFVNESNISQDRNEFNSRILYSSQKIYQSDVEGFDSFPVLNFYDQDESHGEITKLINKDGNVYSIQQRAVSYVPTDSRLLETTDASILSVRSDEFIGVPQYITTFNGSQDMSTVKESVDGFIFLDRLTKDLIKVSGGQAKSIADDRVKDDIETFIEKLSLNSKFRFVSAYDIESNEYYLLGYGDSDSFGLIYSNAYDLFTTKLSLPSYSNPLYPVFVKDEVYIPQFSQVNQLDLNKLDSSASSYSILGGLDESSIEFVVNPNVEIPKMFNNVNIFSRGILGTVTTTSNHVDGSSVVILDDSDLLEGTYRIKTLRGVNNRRLRGQYAKQNITWPLSFKSSDLIHVITKYDISRKPI